MGTVRINGRTFDAPNGGSIVIDGNSDTIAGQKVDFDKEFPKARKLSIVVEGMIGDLTSHGDITVNSNVVDARTTNGDLTVNGDVENSVSTTNGDVRVRGSIGGNVSTVTGDISK